jgi:L-seryl-tRNA(Ser) seleniumtransferase
MPEVTTDRFGNIIDPDVGYARGRVLRSSYEETLRLAHARVLIRNRLAAAGPGSIQIFTGNPRGLPISCADLQTLCDDWTGPACFDADLKRVVLEHLGGSGAEEIGVFNRTSAGLIAAIVALAGDGVVIALSSRHGATHASVVRGARLARARFTEISTADTLVPNLGSGRQLVVITSFSSELATVDIDTIRRSVQIAHERGVPVLLDDAYGARLRPVTQHGPRSLELGVDLAISNSDKAGMFGPRAGFMAGRADLVGRAVAKASENGQEARAPIAAGVLRSLERYDPAALLEEIEAGNEVCSALSSRLGSEWVNRTPLGPMVSEEDVLALALHRAGSTSSLDVVPTEASAALGMLLLRDFGLLTVNAAGAPGARASLRLKPIPGALDAAGGAPAVAAAVDSSLNRLASVIDDPVAMRMLILGGAN